MSRSSVHCNVSKTGRRWRLVATVVAIAACFIGSAATAIAENVQKKPESDDTLRVRSLDIPPSEYWSPAFREMYAKMVVRAREAATKPRTDPHPVRHAPKAEWDEFDASLEAYLAEPLAAVLSRYSVKVAETKIGGVRAADIRPKEGIGPKNRRRVLINVHGGGFVDFRGLSFGKLESIPVASMGRMRVVTLDYRQSPYFQYPAASEDVEAVYRELLKEYPAQSIGIFGCSAGGILAAQSVAWLRARGLPRPGAIGISGFGLPVSLEQARMGDSRMWGLGVPSEQTSEGLTALGSITSAANTWYLRDVPSEDSTAYPGASDEILSQFPPTLFLAGTREWPMSMAVVDHARLLRLGVDSSLYLMEGAPHCAHVLAPDTPESRDASAYIARWFDQRLKN